MFFRTFGEAMKMKSSMSPGERDEKVKEGDDHVCQTLHEVGRGGETKGKLVKDVSALTL